MVASALRGDLFGTGAGIFRRIGKHLDFFLSHFRVNELRRFGGEQYAPLDQGRCIQFCYLLNVFRLNATLCVR
jgi:hypothetical protein